MADRSITRPTQRARGTKDMLSRGYAQDGHREIGNLYTTLLHAAGARRKYFGVHDAMLKDNATSDGPLPELMV